LAILREGWGSKGATIYYISLCAACKPSGITFSLLNKCAFVNYLPLQKRKYV